MLDDGAAHEAEASVLSDGVCGMNAGAAQDASVLSDGVCGMNAGAAHEVSVPLKVCAE